MKSRTHTDFEDLVNDSFLAAFLEKLRACNARIFSSRTSGRLSRNTYPKALPSKTSRNVTFPR